jgi:hypothetical protein
MRVRFPGLPDVRSLNSFFYTKLMEDGYNYDRVKTWTSRRDLMRSDKILVPINMDASHWVTSGLGCRAEPRWLPVLLCVCFGLAVLLWPLCAGCRVPLH